MAPAFGVPPCNIGCCHTPPKGDHHGPAGSGQGRVGPSVPVVDVMNAGPPDRVSFLPDEEQGPRLALEHLLALGRQRIAHVTGPARFRVAGERAEGWRAALDAEGLKPHGPGAMNGRWSEAWGHEAVARLWAADPPDAVFCGSDQITCGMVDALRERGVRVPADAAVVGFGNWEIVAPKPGPLCPAWT